MPRWPRSVLLATTFILLHASLASAQHLDPQHYHPAATLTGLSTVKGAASEAPWTWTLSTQAIYMKDPLVVVDEQGNPRASLIANRVDLVVGFALGLDIPFLMDLGIIKGIDVAAVVPYVVVQHQEAALRDGQLVQVDKIGSGLADPRLEMRITLPIPDAWGFDVAIIPVVSFPAAIGTRYAGSGSVVFTPELAASGQVGPVVLAANVGARVREEMELKSLDVPHQLSWRAGVGFDVGWVGGPKDLLITAEGFGVTRLTRPFHAVQQSPTEVVFSGRYRIGQFVVNAGVGPGLTTGYGAPAVRALAGFAWAPRDNDLDDDGIEDDVDQCVDVPEDFDAFEDGDGCPDPDNDGDKLLDGDDACPDQPEDYDTYKDDDGCPDPDNDEDDIPDVSDRCPLHAEDKDGFNDEDGCPDPDNDEDGILDVRDQCPNEPEDVDDFRDADGCPDPDNDEDGIPDAQDQCPLQPEDYNNQRDDDGCPDARDDKDGDGLVDVKDKCPLEAEDKDGFEDDDGCPELDNDGDGVPDAKDACPMEPEDMDGFLDDDGCPEDDNDGDGIWDKADKCPNEAEVINGFEDDDGCPDEGRQLVKLTAKRIEIAEKVYFDTGSDRIQERSFALLDQVASVLTNHEHVKRVRIEGHTDDRGSESYNLDLSQRRAESVRRYLINKGILPERLEAIGYGESKPVASNSTERGRETNRRVEFTIPEAPAEPGLETLPPPPNP